MMSRAASGGRGRGGRFSEVQREGYGRTRFLRSDRMYGDLVESQQRELVRLFEALAGPGRHTRFLEVGFGEGLLLKRMATHYPESTFQGIEVTPRYVDRLNAEGYDVRLADADVLDLDRTYDVIYGTGVVHHLEFPYRFLDRLHDYLEPGGLLVFGAEAHRLAVLNHLYALIQGHWHLERGALALSRHRLGEALRRRYAASEVYYHDQSLFACLDGSPHRLYRAASLHRAPFLNELWLYARK